MNSYPIGEPVHCTVAWQNSSGVATDPTTIVAKIRTPAGTITTYTYGTDSALVRDGVGLYHIDVTPTSGGVWSYRWVASGALVAANEAEFYVQYSDFGVNG